MTLKVLVLILVSVSLSAVAQIALKFGMSGAKIQSLLQQEGLAAGLFAYIFTNPSVLAGLGMYILGAMLWLFVLARLDVSMAYPFIGLGFIITMALGALVLGETLTVGRVVGTLLVAGGVVLISLQPAAT